MKFQYRYSQGIFQRFINRIFVFCSENLQNKEEEEEEEEEVTECLSN